MIATPSKQTATAGPYSALFDLEAEAREEEERKKKLQDAQSKIMRTNAVGEALRLITEGIGGSAGASIVQRPVNQAIFRASDRYNALEDQSTARMDRIKLADLAAREKDLGYKQGLEAEGRQNEEWKNRQGAESTEWDRRFRVQETAREKQFKDTAAKQKELETHQTNENIRQAKAIYELQKQSVVRSDRTKPYKKDDLLFQIPGTTQKIYLGNEEVGEMAHLLIKELKDAGTYINDPTLKAFERNEAVKMTSLLEVIKQNWDKVKYALPEYSDQKPAEASPAEKRKLEYDTKLQSLYDDSSLSTRKRVKRITDLNEQYKDLFEVKTEAIAPDNSGVTDVSSIFN